MSSTEFTIGLGEGRSSSKVLKPPGGGCSDIFGKGPLVASKQQHENTSQRLFGAESAPTKVHSKKFVQRNPITGEIIERCVNNNEDKSDDEKSNEENIPQEENIPKEEYKEKEAVPEAPLKTKPTSIAVRQPPGGKSSGIF